MATPPDAFLSYTHFDDQYHGGAISEFRDRLSDAVRAMTARPFDIFQDIDGIGLGQNWRKRLNIALGEARFFIPILTPSYFGSQACRDELETFLAFERESGRDDLILPIYWIRCPMLENRELRAQDPLAELISDRQRRDWRSLRHRPYSDSEVREALEGLAEQIDEARLRVIAAPDRDSVAPADRLESTPAVRPRPELRPGGIFRDIDAPWCPEMVVIPAGSFIMGDNRGTDSHGYPLTEHRVTIAHPFAAGRYPVTFDEYDHFTTTTGRDQLSDRGWGRGRRPAIGVYYTDAEAYVEWLSGQTGQPYRLPSEAEWEYACRAGTTSSYWWGDDIDPEKANCGGNVGRTTQVGSYPPNPWGLCDMHGNVWEWVEAAYITYDSRANPQRVMMLRGGSFLDPGPSTARDDGRYPISRDDNYVGFRVARTLSQRS